MILIGYLGGQEPSLQFRYEVLQLYLAMNQHAGEVSFSVQIGTRGWTVSERGSFATP